MSISGISGMGKAFSSIDDIDPALRGSDDLLESITEAVSSVSRFYKPSITEDEVNHRPAIWQQMACTP